jgi:hypothetical protein
VLGRPTAPQPGKWCEGDLIPDNRLAPEAEDLLDHDVIARGVAETAWTAEAPASRTRGARLSGSTGCAEDLRTT